MISKETIALFQRNKTILLLISLAAFALTFYNVCGRSPHEGCVLVHEGESDYRIIIDDTASRSTVHAAVELQRFVHEMTGASLPIFTDRIAESPLEIVIGRSNRLDKDSGIDFDSLGDEGYVIRTEGSRLILAGGDRRGNLYAVYGLLEDHLDCHWFTADISHIPQSYSLTLPDIDDRQNPMISYREPYAWEAFNGDWAARNRMNRNSKSGGLAPRHGGKVEWVPEMFVHTFEKLVPPDKHFRRHPEYFSLINGRRKKTRSQLCTTNEKVVEMVTEGCLAAFREHPEADVLSLSQNDWFGYCECKKCQAIADKEESQIAPVLLMVNRVAEAVDREFPGKMVETLAYQWTRKPPKTIRPRDNVVIRLCTIECCFAHPLDSCDSEENKAFAADLRAWSKAADKLWVWNYVTTFTHYFVPYPNLRVRDDNIRFFAEHNVTAIFQQDIYTTPNGELSGLSNYLNAKLLWDPYYGEERAINGYLDGVYGPAAEPVRAYIDLIHDAVERENIHMGVWQGPDAEFLTDSILSAADSLWNEAATLARDDEAILERIAIDRLSTDYAIIAQGMNRAKAYIIDHEKLSVDIDPAFTARLDSFCDTAARAEVIKLKEYGYSIEEYRADVEKAVKAKKLSYMTPRKTNVDDKGLRYRYFEGDWKKIPDFSKLKADKSGDVKRFRLPFQWTDDSDRKIYGFLINGFITVETDGVYTFFIKSDGYTELRVGGRKINGNSGRDPVRERSGFVALKAGSYPVEAKFFTREGGTRLEIYYAGPGMEKQEVTNDMLSR